MYIRAFNFDHKVTSSIIIILKIEVSTGQPLGTPISNPEKGPKSEENDRPLPEGSLRTFDCHGTVKELGWFSVFTRFAKDKLPVSLR